MRRSTANFGSGGSFLESNMRRLSTDRSSSTRSNTSSYDFYAEGTPRSDLDKWLADSSLLVMLPYLQKQGLQSLDSIKLATEKIVLDESLASGLRDRFSHEVQTSFRIQVEVPEEYDVYISHMWEGDNSDLARHLKVQLERLNKSLKIFDLFNPPSLDNLDHVMRKTANVVIVWSDRMFTKPAMVAEIRAALRAKKNIVLVYEAILGADNKDHVPSEKGVPEDLLPMFFNMRSYRRERDFRDDSVRGILRLMKPRRTNEPVDVITSISAIPTSPPSSTAAPGSGRRMSIGKPEAGKKGGPVAFSGSRPKKGADESRPSTAAAVRVDASSIHRHPLYRTTCQEAYGSSYFACDKCSRMFYQQQCYHCSVCGNFDLCTECYESAAAKSAARLVQAASSKAGVAPVPKTLQASPSAAVASAIHEHPLRFSVEAQSTTWSCTACSKEHAGLMPCYRCSTGCDHVMVCSECVRAPAN
eukprot:TRINITY_DN18486_c0_g1_i1.p1 TRINITY_DN18486_c0_g1~~TRINITY_DN18486_c0_g1_i1.p1  ORF type:complete len:500 (-),score=58.84 TRINITY_DN18486_c0_g1_i1:734-2149(-)